MKIIKEPLLKIVRRWEEKYRTGLFKVETPMVFLWEIKKAVITVDAGVYTDFSSIPVGFRNIFEINGDHRIAAIIHDYLYERRGEVTASQLQAEDGSFFDPEEPAIIKYTRKDADELFFNTMIEEGVQRWMALAMYKAVRIFGSSYAEGWIE